MGPRSKSAGDGEEEARPQNQTLSVIAALVAAIHVDPRNKPAGDGEEEATPHQPLALGLVRERQCPIAATKV